MNILKLTLVDNDEVVYINADTITHVIEHWDGTEVYIIGRKKPLYVNEEVDDVVKVLLKLDRKGEYEQNTESKRTSIETR